MQIVSSSIVEDCTTAGRTWRYRFDSPVTRGAILSFARLGELELYSEFPHPFYRVTSPQGFRLKGTEGEHSCLVAFPTCETETWRESFEQLALAA